MNSVKKILDGLNDYVESSSQAIMQELSVPQNNNDQRDLELQQAKQRIQQLETELQDCHAQIFRSIPNDEVSDATLQEKYSRLRECVSNWVEGLPEIHGFVHTLDRMRARSVYDPLSRRKRMSSNTESNSQFEILKQIIFHQLWRFFLTDSLYGALPHDQLFLRNLQSHMRHLEPTNDEKRINLWLSDAARAYTTLSHYKEGVKRNSNLFKGSIYGDLQAFKFIGKVDWEQKLKTFNTQVVDQAAEIAIKMSCSPEQYEWKWYQDSHWYAHGIVYKRDMENFVIMDERTHNKVPDTMFTAIPDDAKIGDFLMVIYPALFRRGGEGHTDIRIEKAVMLIHVREPSPEVNIETDQEASPEVKVEADSTGFDPMDHSTC